MKYVKALRVEAYVLGHAFAASVLGGGEIVWRKVSKESTKVVDANITSLTDA